MASNVGSSSDVTVVKVLKCDRNPAIWFNYDLVELSNGSKKARCKQCQGLMNPASNTSLKNHTEKSCPTLKRVASRGQSSMGHDGGIWNFDPNTVRERMAKLVIQQALPFNHFDNQRLTSLIQDCLQPRYQQVSRTTLRRDALKLWKTAKNELVLGFENLETGVNLTTDVWSAPHGIPDSYICVTAHWVDPQTWQMMKRTIAFELFDYPHTGQNLFYILDSIINKFKLQEKILSISFDNASNNNNAVAKLKMKYKPICNGIFFHSRCIAHIINLAVQDGLRNPQVLEITTAFREMLKNVFSNKVRRRDYMRLCRDTNNICLSPNWDVETRWNSTHKMFHSALRQKDTLQVFHGSLVESNPRHFKEFPASSWEIIENITQMLKVFKEATVLLSGVYYPTSPLALQQIFLMSHALTQLLHSDPIFIEMMLPMRAKLVKYFREMPPVITCAAALNPCLNVHGVEVLITKICDDLNLDNENQAVFFSSHVIATFNKSLEELFDVYLRKYGAQTTLHDRRGEGSSSHNDDVNVNLYNEYMSAYTKRSRGNTPTSELGRYTNTNFLQFMPPSAITGVFDVLGWWKENGASFPILSAMARDLLTVQASTVASESAFSFSGRTLSLRRTRLTPESMEMCLCLKDHLDAMERVQHQSSLEEELGVGFEQEIQEEEVELGLSEAFTTDEDDSRRGVYDDSDEETVGS